MRKIRKPFALKPGTLLVDTVGGDFGWDTVVPPGTTFLVVGYTAEDGNGDKCIELLCPAFSRQFLWSLDSEPYRAFIRDVRIVREPTDG